MNIGGEERTGGHHVGLIVRISKDDFHRVGHCWMEGRLLDGDLAMAIKQSGDCFWEYELLEHHFTLGNGRPGYKLIRASNFGAYVLGTHYEYQPTEREMHLLLAGEMTSFASNPNVASWCKTSATIDVI